MAQLARGSRRLGLHALALGLALLAGAPAAVAEPGDDAAQRALLKRGRQQYRLYCTSCHGWTSRGEGSMAQALELGLIDFRDPEFRWDTDGDGRPGSDLDLRNVILNGVEAYLPDCAEARADERAEVPPSCMMPGYKEVLDVETADAIVAYLRSLEGQEPRRRSGRPAPQPAP